MSTEYDWQTAYHKEHADLCSVEARNYVLEQRIKALEGRNVELNTLAFEWMARHDRIAAGEDGGPHPSPVDVPAAYDRIKALEAENGVLIDLRDTRATFVAGLADRIKELGHLLTLCSGPLGERGKSPHRNTGGSTEGDRWDYVRGSYALGEE